MRCVLNCKKGEYCNNCIVKAWLNNQPTAYDVDKVVEQLKLTSKTALDLAIKRIPGFRFMAPGFQALIDECFEEAAEIVKAGGNIELSKHSKSQGNRTGKQKATIEAQSKTE